VTILRVAAELIRHAAKDENYVLDLHEAARDEVVFSALVLAPVQVDDLPALRPSEWLWFARWRQGMGGPLDVNLLRWIDEGVRTGSREARFRLRGLAMCDPSSERVAETAEPFGYLARDPGLTFLQEHATTFGDGFEVARDALQYASPASWFTLRVLTTERVDTGSDVRRYLTALADRLEISDEVTARWYGPPR
jgi:hypothetical protein